MIERFMNTSYSAMIVVKIPLTQKWPPPAYKYFFRWHRLQQHHDWPLLNVMYDALHKRHSSRIRTTLPLLSTNTKVRGKVVLYGKSNSRLPQEPLQQRSRSANTNNNVNGML